jgi:hypothetical protein
LSADPRRSALDAEVLGWLREPDWQYDEARFDALALRAFAFQHEHCTPYRRFCNATGHSPADVGRWQDIPAVPTGAFKELRIASFAAQHDVALFRTSGSSTARRGTLHLDTLELYQASLLPTLSRLLFPDLAPGVRTTLRILAPPPAECPDSSLSHMFGCLLAAIGDEHSGYDVAGGQLDADGLRRALSDATSRGMPVALLGTASSFVHLLDSLEAQGEPGLALPGGSRVMETGGFKGRAREVPRDELHGRISTTLGVPPHAILNQYGMTELASQFYDSSLADPSGSRRKLGPPWARVRLIDPESGEEPAPGEPGVIHVHDLANTGSVCALQTADLGRSIPGDPRGFEVLGRLAGAEQRGCSIAADTMLGEAP